MPDGKLYAKTAFNYFTADDNFNADGHRVDFLNNGKFFDKNAAVYLEYGLQQDITLIGNFVYKHLKYEDNHLISKSYGVGDVELGARYGIMESLGGMLSVQALAKIPEAYDETDAIPLGNGQYDLEIRLLYGRTLYPAFPGYINFEVGYRFRSQEPVDELRYLVEIGADVTENLYGRMKLDGVLGMGNMDDEQGTVGNPTATNEYDIGKLDICIGYKFTETYGVEIGAIPAVFGRNTAAGITWSMAFVLQL